MYSVCGTIQHYQINTPAVSFQRPYPSFRKVDMQAYQDQDEIQTCPRI